MAAKILITGGSGYIGSVLTPMLLEEGYKVTVLDNLMYRQASLTNCCRYPGFTFIHGDCRDKDAVKPLIKKADIIIPLAALVGAPLCEQNKIDATTTNFDAVAMLCALASKKQKILIPITNSGYGIGKKNKYCTEESALRPITLYGITKVKAEKTVLERENSISFRLATVFGMSPRMRLDLLVNDFVYRAVNDRSLVIFEGHFKRNYIHIQDVARVFIHGIENFKRMKGKPYNVGLDEANLSKLELCEAIKKHIPNFTYLEAPIGEDPDKRDYIVSNARIAETGFKPKWSLDQGIEELVKGFAMIKKNQYSNV